MWAGVTALVGETHRKGANRLIDRLTKVGWIAAISLLIAGIATVAHSVVTAAETAEQQRRLEQLLEEIAKNAKQQKALRESESLALQEKQAENDELRSQIQKLREPRVIYSKTLTLPRSGKLDLQMVPKLQSGDQVDFRVFPGTVLQEIRKKVKLPFGKYQTITVGMKQSSIQPDNLILVTSSATHKLDMETGQLTLGQDSTVSELTFKLPTPEDSPTSRASIRTPARFELTITRSPAE